MTFFQLLDHIANFAAPALFMALAMVLGARLLAPRRVGAPSLRKQFAVLFGVGLAVLVLGLVFFGRDGKMLTYFALVLACGTAQWLLGGHWRR